jgi:hypothetical protein
MTDVKDKLIETFEHIIEKSIDKIDNGVAQVYGDGKELASNTANAISNVPSNLVHAVETIEQIPETLAKKVSDFKESVKLLKTLPENVAEATKDIAILMSDSIQNQSANIEAAAITGLTNMTDIAGKAVFESLKTVPVIGSGVAVGKGTAETTIAFAKAANRFGKIATQIVDDITEKAEQTILNKPIQAGGAKTRRHLKQMIREREKIQTRTNKMIRDFMNPVLAKTRNKKNISKKSKRRRHRR